MTSLRPRLDNVDLTEATWRGRAIRYVAIYLALALLLVGARYLTQEIRPALRVAQDQEAKLLTQRNDLAVRVQTLENPQRIRDWAFANDMLRFAEAPKESQAILPLPPPPDGAGSPRPDRSASSSSSTSPAQPASPDLSTSPTPSTSPAQPENAAPDNTVEVRTQWR